MQRKSKDEQKEIIERYRQNGLSVRAFCSDKSFSEQTLRNWIIKAKSYQNTHQSFVEVSSDLKRFSQGHTEQTSIKMFPQKSSVLLHLQSGVSIEVFPDSDHETVKWIIDLIQRNA